MGPTRVLHLLLAGATEEEPSASPAIGAAAAGAAVEGAVGALGPAPAATTEGLAATEEPAAAGRGLQQGGKGPGAPLPISVSSSRLCHLQT